jgi:putative transposase
MCYKPSVMKPVQGKLFQTKASLQYGGVLRNKAKNRGARPLSKKDSIHVVMRSSKAKGSWSFQAVNNRKRLTEIVKSLSLKSGVQILSFANVGNHLHMHVRITNRTLYKAWIRGLTSAIAMLVAKRKGLQALKDMNQKFWDYRPFSRIISGLKSFLTLKDYIQINQFEGAGISRLQAVQMIRNNWGSTINRSS